jgi:hypothetical protein
LLQILQYEFAVGQIVYGDSVHAGSKARGLGFLYFFFQKNRTCAQRIGSRIEDFMAA